MKQILQNILKKFGYKIGKISPYTFRYDWLRNYNIQTIIDVGANQGQFALEMREVFQSVQIHSFEPIKDVFDVLVKNTQLQNITCYQLGVGAENSVETINHTVSGNATSSMLEFGQGHHSNFSHWTDTIKEEINIVSLDNHFRNATLPKNIFLKIDVQGYEDKVLLGAESFLENVTVIQLETSFVEMYKGQKLYPYFYDILTKKGFTLIGTIDNFYDKADGRPIYCDLLFVKV